MVIISHKVISKGCDAAIIYQVLILLDIQLTLWYVMKSSQNYAIGNYNNHLRVRTRDAPGFPKEERKEERNGSLPSHT